MGQLRRTLSGALKKGDVVPTGGSVASGATPTYSPSPNSGTTSTNTSRKKASSKKKGY